MGSCLSGGGDKAAERAQNGGNNAPVKFHRKASKRLSLFKNKTDRLRHACAVGNADEVLALVTSHGPEFLQQPCAEVGLPSFLYLHLVRFLCCDGSSWCLLAQYVVGFQGNVTGLHVTSAHGRKKLGCMNAFLANPVC